MAKLEDRIERNDELEDSSSEIVVTHNPRCSWIKNVTVEPTMSLYMFAFMITSVVEQTFFVYKACTVNHNYTTEICDRVINSKQDSIPGEYDEIKQQIQITVSNFYQWNSIASQIFPIFIAMFLGSWSDRHGRKFPLIMGLFGKFVYSTMIIVNAASYNWPVEYIIYTATIPCALTGADLAIFASCFSYISDVSTVTARTMRIAILEICYLATIPTGVALGSFLYNNVFNGSFVYMFSVNVTILAIAIIYSFLRLKCTTTEQQTSLKEYGFIRGFRDFFDKTHVIKSIKVLVKKRENFQRPLLFISLIMMALYTFQRDEKPFLFLYTQLKFKWGVKEYSIFKTFQSSAYFIMTLLSIPLMSKILKWKDTTIIYAGSTAHALARVFYLLADVPWLFFLGSTISSLGPVTAPVIRSMISKAVSVSERGKIFALLSVCDNATPFISSILYTQTYNATIGGLGGIYILTIVTQCGVFFLALFIHIMSKRYSSVNDNQPKCDALIDNSS